MSSSIRARTTAVFAIVVAALMALACAGLVSYARRTAERNAADTLKAARAIALREFADEGETDPSRVVTELEEDLRPDNLSLFLVDADGRIVHGSGHPPFPRSLTDPRLWRTTRVPVGEQLLVIVLPWSKSESSLWLLTRTLLLLWAFVVAITTVGAWVLVGRTLSPIARLSSQANTTTIEGMQVRLTEPSRDAEIVGLVATLNGLLERLSETALAKGRFYSAASHELRTPLQALSGHLELALDRERTKDEYRLAVEEAYRQTRRLIKLTGALLLLHQLDSCATPAPESADLVEICHNNLSQLESVVTERSLRIVTDLPDSVPLIAPVTHPEVLVRNLLENAVRYASDGGDVSVRIEQSSKQVIFRVFNSADLPPDWSAEPLFEPFARPDFSRNAATGGAGLGLAICRAIADTNGWTLTLAGEPQGVMSELVIPLG